MTPHELVGGTSGRVGDREVPGLFLELRQEDRLIQKVAELFPEGGVVVMVDCLEHLVGFLEHERLQRIDGLFAIPRTPVGCPEPRHDPDQSSEFCGGCGDHRIW
jgi:hypothetical protein